MEHFVLQFANEIVRSIYLYSNEINKSGNIVMKKQLTSWVARFVMNI